METGSTPLTLNFCGSPINKNSTIWPKQHSKTSTDADFKDPSRWRRFLETSTLAATPTKTSMSAWPWMELSTLWMFPTKSTSFTLEMWKTSKKCKRATMDRSWLVYTVTKESTKWTKPLIPTHPTITWTSFQQITWTICGRAWTHISIPTIITHMRLATCLLCTSTITLEGSQLLWCP